MAPSRPTLLYFSTLSFAPDTTHSCLQDTTHVHKRLLQKLKGPFHAVHAIAFKMYGDLYQKEVPTGIWGPVWYKQYGIQKQTHELICGANLGGVVRNHIARIKLAENMEFCYYGPHGGTIGSRHTTKSST